MDDLTKRRIRIVLGVTGFVFLLALGYWLGLPAYKNWKQERFLKQANEYLAKADYRNASLCARKVLEVNPSNPRACRVMIQITEAVRSPEVVNWLQRVVDLEPHIFTNRLALAKAAFVHGNPARAQKVLDGTGEADRKTAAYHEMAALLAVSSRKLDDSEAHFAEAVRLDPDNKRLQLNLAVLQLQGGDRDLAGTAWKNLERLSTDEKFRVDALRVLAGSALQSNDFAGALVHTKRLASDPSATLDDRLLHLNVLSKAKNPGLDAYLAKLQTEVAKNPDQIYSLAGWMLGKQLTNDVRQWLNSLPPETKDEVPVRLARADVCIVTKDWTALDALLNERKWGPLEFVRLALLSRVTFENKQTMTHQVHWRAAVKEANENPRALSALVQMANAWGWNEQKTDLLWLILQRFPQQRWALDQLNRSYLETGDTRSLLKVYSSMREYDAKNMAVNNNFAATSLLLKQNVNLACELAKESYAQRPDDAAIASTYAYALHLQGKTGEAVQVLEKLKAQELEKPSIAAYYGAILSASGQTNKAKQYLQLAAGGRLLPEEKQMVEEALKR